MPLASGNILLHLLELSRIVFLHPHVLDSPFVIEIEVRVLIHQGHVLCKGILDILIDGSLHVPVPLGVQMSIGNQEQCFLVSLPVSQGAENKEQKEDNRPG